MKVKLLLLTGIIFIFSQYAYAAPEDLTSLNLYGATISTVHFDTSDPDSSNYWVYALNSSPDRFYTAHVGLTDWSEINVPFTIEGFDVTQNDGTIIASTSSSDTDYAYISTNHGVGWTAIDDFTEPGVPVVSASNYIYIMGRPPSDPLAPPSDDRQIYMSSDSGTTWSEQLSSVTTDIATVYAMDAVEDGSNTWIWAIIGSATSGGKQIYRWQIAGGTSTETIIDYSSLSATMSPAYLSVDPNNPANVWIQGTTSAGAGFSVIKTTLGTTTAAWTEVSGTGNISDGDIFFTSDSSRTYIGKIYTDDGGTTITDLPKPSVGTNEVVDNINAALGILPGNDNVVYFATDKGVSWTSDGAVTTTNLTSGISAVVASDALTFNSSASGETEVILIASKSGISRTVDGGSSWIYTKHGTRWNSLYFESTNGYLFAGDNAGDCRASTNNGLTWLQTGCGDAAEADPGITVSVRVYDIYATASAVYVAIASPSGTVGGLFKGTWDGNPEILSNWTWVNLISTSTPILSVFGDGTYLYAGYGDPETGQASAGLLVSTNESDWTDISALSGQEVRRIAADPTNSSRMYAVAGFGGSTSDAEGAIFRSTDAGVTWTDVSPTSSTGFVYVAVDPNTTANVYACGGNTIWISIDYGATWNSYYEGTEEFYCILFSDSFSTPAASSAAAGPRSGQINIQTTDGTMAFGSESGLFLDESATTWYFAEGCTSSTFDTYFLIANPNSTNALVSATYYKADGTTVAENYTVEATSRYTVHADSVSGLESTEVSAKFESTNDVGIAAERAMYWNDMAKGHDTVGVTAPSTVWYFAEGCTAADYDLYILLMNPSASITANAALTLMKSNGTTEIYNTTVDAQSRKTIHVDDIIASDSMSTRVDSNIPIVAERAMYWNSMASGHCSIGTSSASSTWYLPEGYTGGTFDTWVLIMNPNDSSVDCDVTFYINNGDPVTETVTVGANARYTIHVDDQLSDHEVSTYINAGSNQVVAERAMYWGSGDDADGHCSIGTKTLASGWYLAEGCTAGTFSEWILLMNPSASEATVTVTYLKSGGDTVSGTYTVPAQSRYTISVDGVEGLAEASVSASISSTLPIAVERAMYFSDSGGHVSKGIR